MQELSKSLDLYRPIASVYREKPTANRGVASRDLPLLLLVFTKGSLLTFKGGQSVKKKKKKKFDLQDCCNGIGSVFWDFGSFRHKPHRKEVIVSPSYLPFQQGPISLNWSRLAPVVTSALDHSGTQIAWTHDSLSSYSTYILHGQDYCLEKRESLLLLPFSKNQLASDAPDGSNQWSFQLTNLS